MDKKTFKSEQGFYPMLSDTHRAIPKKDGGEYTPENTTVHVPGEHMEIHNILRIREEKMDLLKASVDDRQQIIKLRNKVANQILAMHRGTDRIETDTEIFLQEILEQVEKRLKIKTRGTVLTLKNTEHPILAAAKGVKGVGDITLAYLLSYIDIKKAKQASALWAYCGYHRASHERYQKGTAGGGNKTLRTALFNTGASFIKQKSPYADVYYREKARLEASVRIVPSYTTQGVLKNMMWKETKKSHRHGAAMRKMIKHFLADFWLVWRTLEGLDTRPLYVEEKLGHTSIIKPEERGWVY